MQTAVLDSVRPLYACAVAKPTSCFFHGSISAQGCKKEVRSETLLNFYPRSSTALYWTITLYPPLHPPAYLPAFRLAFLLPLFTIHSSAFHSPASSSGYSSINTCLPSFWSKTHSRCMLNIYNWFFLRIWLIFKFLPDFDWCENLIDFLLDWSF